MKPQDGAPRSKSSASAPKWINTRAVCWALYEAPDVPASCVATLVVLASHANGDGTPEHPKVNGWNSYPSVPLMAALTRKSDRQVSRDVETLLKSGLVRIPRDQSAATHLAADKRPTVYDMGYSPLRPHVDPSDHDSSEKGRRRRPASKSGRDLSSMTGRSNDLTSMTGRDLSSMTERPDVHDQSDLSWTSGEEEVEEEQKNSLSPTARGDATNEREISEEEQANPDAKILKVMTGRGATTAEAVRILADIHKAGLIHSPLAWAKSEDGDFIPRLKALRAAAAPPKASRALGCDQCDLGWVEDGKGRMIRCLTCKPNRTYQFEGAQ